MTSTIELTIQADEEWQELLIAELADLGFDVFWQEEHTLKAYLDAPRWDGTKRDQLERWLAEHNLPSQFEERLVEPENWNRQWEETIKPIVVGSFLIKPTWSEPLPEQRDLIVLEIDPKMSFGTGYHESTRLVLRALQDVITGGERVLDAGTGTGVLAIAAVKLGAASAVTFDNDEWVQVNAVENFYLNGVADRISFKFGGLEVVEERDFDLVLANINRNVLIEFLPGFAERMRPGAGLILSGLLIDQDRDRMIDEAAEYGFNLSREDTEGPWWSGGFTYTPGLQAQ